MTTTKCMASALTKTAGESIRRNEAELKILQEATPTRMATPARKTETPRGEPGTETIRPTKPITEIPITPKKPSALSPAANAGKTKVDSILDPLRKWRAEGEAVKDVDATRSTAISKLITSYGEDISPNSPGQRFNQMLTGDPQVLEYLGTLPTKEYSQMRMDVAGWFGGEYGTKGAMGRNLENAYKAERIKALDAEYRGILGSQLDEMKSAGFLKGGDLTAIDTWETRMNDIVKIRNHDTFKALDANTRQLDTADKVDIALKNIENTDEAKTLISKGNIAPDTKRIVRAQLETGKVNPLDLAKWKEESTFLQDFKGFTKGVEGAEYDAVKKRVGIPAADEAMRRNALNEIADITGEMTDTTLTQFVLGGKGLNTRETKLMTDIVNGKTVTATDLVEVRNIASKITPEGWDVIKRATRTLDTIPKHDAARIIGKPGESNSIFNAMRTTKGAIATTTGVALFLIAVLYGIPQSILWYGTTTPTNVAEMTGLYEQFKLDKDTVASLEKKLLCDKCLGDINDYLKNLSTMMDRPPFNVLMVLPYYNDYLRSYWEIPLTDNRESIENNFRRMFIDIAETGLVKECSGTLGFCATSKEERKTIYTNTPEKLLKLDKEYVQTQLSNMYPNIDMNGKSGIIGPDNEELSNYEAAILYYRTQNKLTDTDVSRLTRIPLDSAGDFTGTDSSITPDIKEWGQKNLGEPTTTQATQTLGAGQYTDEGKTWIMSSKGWGLTQSQFDANINAGKNLVPDGKGGWKFEGGTTTAITTATTLGGGSSGGGTQISPYDQQTLDKMKNKERVTANDESSAAKNVFAADSIDDKIGFLENKGMPIEKQRQISFNDVDANMQTYVEKNIDKLSKEKTQKIVSTNQEEYTQAVAVVYGEKVFTTSNKYLDDQNEKGFSDAEAMSNLEPGYVNQMLIENKGEISDRVLTALLQNKNTNVRESAANEIAQRPVDSVVTNEQWRSNKDVKTAFAYRDIDIGAMNKGKFTDIPIDDADAMVTYLKAGHPGMIAFVGKVIDAGLAKGANEGQKLEMYELLNIFGRGGLTETFGTNLPVGMIPKADQALKDYHAFYHDPMHVTEFELKAVDETIQWQDALGKTHAIRTTDMGGEGVYDPTTQTFRTMADKYPIQQTIQIDKYSKYQLNGKEYAAAVLDYMNEVQYTPWETPTDKETILQTAIDKFVARITNVNSNMWGCTGPACLAAGSTDTGGGGGGGSGGAGSGGGTPKEKDLGIYVTCDVKDAEVVENGIVIGPVNTTIKLSQGNHLIEVRRAGYKTYKKLVDIDNYSVTIEATLEKIVPGIATYIKNIGGIGALTPKHLLHVYGTFEQRTTTVALWGTLAASTNITTEVPLVGNKDVLYLWYLVNGDPASAKALVDSGEVNIDDGN